MAVIHSRAYLLIEQEIRKFEEVAPKGIVIYPTHEGNLFLLTVKMKGPKNSLWAKGVFKLRVNFQESFNYTPPMVQFVTIPFHPNVHAVTGKPSCIYLDDPQKWNVNVSLLTVLEDIQNTLAYPNLSCALNQDAMLMYDNNPAEYENIVLQCVEMSLMVEASPEKFELNVERPSSDAGYHRPVVTIEYDPAFLNRPPTKPPPQKSNINFEDYYSEWSKLATSQLDTKALAPLSNVEERNAQHNRLYYGSLSVGKNKTAADTKEANLARVDQMRKIYLAKKAASAVSISTTSRSVTLPLAPERDDFPPDDEVNDLVDWTKQLSSVPSAV